MSGKRHSAPQIREEALQIDDGAPIILHPLVVLNVSDHYTRYVALQMFSGAGSSSHRNNQPPSSVSNSLTDAHGNPRVIGILLGSHHGRVIEICHSVELTAVKQVDGSVEIDTIFMHNRLEQYNQIFGQYVVVGWYSTGDRVTADDLRLHEDVFAVMNEAPILLMMNTNKTSNDLAENGTASSAMQTDATGSKFSLNGHHPGSLTTYQLELKVIDDMPKKLFVPAPHRFASEDSERIAVDHVMRHAIPGGDHGTSSTALHLNNMRGSIKMLHDRLQLIVTFLEATAKGNIPVDHDLLRQVSAVCGRLPALDCREFSDAFATEKSDSLVVSYLSGLTKMVCSLNDTLDKVSRLNIGVPPVRPARRRGAFLRA